MIIYLWRKKKTEILSFSYTLQKAAYRNPIFSEITCDSSNKRKIQTFTFKIQGLIQAIGNVKTKTTTGLPHPYWHYQHKVTELLNFQHTSRDLGKLCGIYDVLIKRCMLGELSIISYFRAVSLKFVSLPNRCGYCSTPQHLAAAGLTPSLGCSWREKGPCDWFFRATPAVKPATNTEWKWDHSTSLYPPPLPCSCRPCP